MKFKILIALGLVLSNVTVMAGYVVKQAEPMLHCISIGINDYPSRRYKLNNCVNDGKAFVKKLRLHNNKTANDSFEGRRSFKFDSVAFYELYNEQVTLENIIQTFKTEALSAHPDDEFIFHFGGLTFENSVTSSYIYPYLKNAIDFQNVNLDSVLTVSELAKLKNQISCYKQPIISESWYGENFAANLLFELFETNPLHINSRQHNRVIITTTGRGMIVTIAKESE
ncbi:MAG: hypothetical protein ACI8SE_000868 [Bacteroidia bacterium]|jgi:hypothetical protein